MGDYSLDDLLRANFPQRPPEKPRPLPEAQVLELQSIFEKYRQTRFKPGDLVVVRRGGCRAEDKDPHIVLEINPNAAPDFSQSEHCDPACQLYGARHDIRIACLLQGVYGAFWAESWYFEPYEPEVK
jgi:hypothetical protein